MVCGRWIEGPHGRVEAPTALLVSPWELEQRDMLPARRDRAARNWRVAPDRALAARLRRTRRDYNLELAA